MHFINNIKQLNTTKYRFLDKKAIFGLYRPILFFAQT